MSVSEWKPEEYVLLFFRELLAYDPSEAVNLSDRCSDCTSRSPGCSVFIFLNAAKLLGFSFLPYAGK